MLPHRVGADSAVREVQEVVPAAVLVVRQALDPTHPAEVRDKAGVADADR